MNFKVCTPPCLRKFCIWWATKCLISRSFLNLNWYDYDFFFFLVACLLAYGNLQGNYFLRFFPTDVGDFTCLAGFFSLMWEILHACRESGRNSVQAGDSLSMRESWKPWDPVQHGCIQIAMFCLNFFFFFWVIGAAFSLDRGTQTNTPLGRAMLRGRDNGHRVQQATFSLISIAYFKRTVCF